METEHVGRLPECKTSRKYDSIISKAQKKRIRNLRSSRKHPHKDISTKGKLFEESVMESVHEIVYASKFKVLEI